MEKERVIRRKGDCGGEPRNGEVGDEKPGFGRGLGRGFESGRGRGRGRRRNNS